MDGLDPLSGAEAPWDGLRCQGSASGEGFGRRPLISFPTLPTHRTWSFTWREQGDGVAGAFGGGSRRGPLDLEWFGLVAVAVGDSVALIDPTVGRDHLPHAPQSEVNERGRSWR